MRWIEAMWSRRDPPDRILVAGCGTGNEVFALHRFYPKAEIVGIDFSRRSIDIARNLQRRFFGKANLRFKWADLTAPNLRKSAGGHYDFITCHGVLSYIEKPGRGLAALEKCLSPGGGLYLGVNGSIHLSQFWRRGLTDFGFDPMTFDARPELRPTLALFDAMAGHDPGFMSKLTEEYLSSDLFGPINHAWPLSRWTRLCARHGLFLRGSYSAHQTLLSVINRELHEQLLPRTRPQAHEVADKIMPTGFHWLILDREKASPTLWANQSVLTKHAVNRTKLYDVQWPAKRNRRRGHGTVIFKSPATNTLVEAKLPMAMVELIRRSDPATSLGELLRSSSTGIKAAELKKHLYLLYLLGAINLRLPASAPGRPR